MNTHVDEKLVASVERAIPPNATLPETTEVLLSSLDVESVNVID